MRGPGWTPSIVPGDNDQTVYVVADDFGKPGRAWAEAEYERTDLEAAIQVLLTGQYSNPIRVVALNTAERWSANVPVEIAQERARRRCGLQMRDIPSFFKISPIVTRAYHDVQLPLRLV
jgi:hypothetical protein